MAAGRDPKNHLRYKRMVPTPDRWYPTFEGGFVCVSVILTTLVWKTPSLRVCAWGGDDFGMERDEFFDTRKEALRVWKRRGTWVAAWGMIDKKTLAQLGFKQA